MILTGADVPKCPLVCSIRTYEATSLSKISLEVPGTFCILTQNATSWINYKYDNKCTFFKCCCKKVTFGLAVHNQFTAVGQYSRLHFRGKH